MSTSDADLLQNVSSRSVAAAPALLYGYGLYEDDARARECALAENLPKIIDKSAINAAEDVE